MRFSAYPAYRPSGVEWLGDVPSEWTVPATKHAFEIQLGKMLQPDERAAEDREIPYLKAQHVQWEKVRTRDLPTMWAAPSEVETYGVRPGDLLVCEGGEVGRSALVEALPRRVIIQNALHRVRPRVGNQNRFLMYVLEHAASQRWFEILSNRATIAHFTCEKFGALPIPLPSTSEQRAIAEFLRRRLQKVDTLLARKRILAAKLADKRDALISHVVTRGISDEAIDTEASGACTPPEGSAPANWVPTLPSGWESKRLKFVAPA